MSVNYDNVKHKLVRSVATAVTTKGEKCTSLCGMEIVGDDAYCLMTNSDDDKNLHEACLCRYPDFLDTTKSRKVFTIADNGEEELFTHANGIAYYRVSGESKGTFYIATSSKGTDAIIGVDAKGNITKHITCTEYILSITSCGNGKFIVGTSHTSTKTKTRNYAVGHVNSKSVFAFDKSDITLACVDNYTIGNDIYYDKTAAVLYIPMFQKNSKGNVTDNIIMACPFDLNNLPDTLTPTRVMKDYESSTGIAKYEIEGMAIYNNKKYVANNADADGIYQIYK